MTANYDTLLDPPSDDLCLDHGQAHPCLVCRAEAYEEWYESRRKGELFEEDVLGNRAL